MLVSLYKLLLENNEELLVLPKVKLPKRLGFDPSPSVFSEVFLNKLPLPRFPNNPPLGAFPNKGCLVSSFLAPSSFSSLSPFKAASFFSSVFSLDLSILKS